MRALAAGALIRAAWKDVWGRSLGGLTAICVVVALSATIGAAWAGFHYLVPLIPEGLGFWAHVSTLVHWLAGAGVVVLAIVLAPAISMLVGGALFDVAAARIERQIGAPPGRAVSLGEGLWNAARTALPALVLNLIALPFIFVPVLNVIVFLWLNGYLMGREYATCAAIRRMSWVRARALRRSAPLSVFLIGLVCSLIPFVAPLVGASAMTRLVTQLGANNDSDRK